MQMGPAERVDVVIDFAGRLGQELYLMDGYKMIPILKFRVTQHVTDNSTIPATLRPLPDIGEPTVTRNWNFDQTAGHWTINGQQFDPARVDAHPVLGTTERWVLANPTEVTHMVHIHDVDQQCLSRDGGPCYPYETMKETWALGSGETLELKMKFTDHLGKYMFHCHILEHEDDGMMSQFEVVAPVVPTRVVSRKAQGSAGAFDVVLPLTGTPGIDCRSGGVNQEYQVVFIFPNAVTFQSAQVTSGQGSVISTNGNGTTTVTVNLAGVTNAQTITLKLAGVSDGTATNDVSVPMSVLIGDTNWTGSVNAADVAQTKVRIGQNVDANNFRSDINANGTINASDTAIVKANIGSSIRN